MKAKDLIKIYVTRNSEVIDISDGTINLEFQYGNDFFEGIWQRPDSGQLILTTRNQSLDPHINELIRFNSKITITKDDWLIGTFYITEINVDYSPTGGNSIITINGTDLFGLLARHSWTESFEDWCRDNYPLGALTLTQLGEALFPGVGQYFVDTDKIEIPNMNIITAEHLESLDGQLTNYNNISSVAIKAGENALDTVLKLSQSNLSTMLLYQGTGIVDYPYEKYTPDTYLEYPPIEDQYNYISPENSFTSDGTGYSYKSIIINDGFSRTANQVIIKNLDRVYGAGTTFTESNDNFGPYTVEQSVNEWGSGSVEFDTFVTGDDNVANTFATIARDILETSISPKISVSEITYDAIKHHVQNYETLFPGKTIRIIHDINDDVVIDKYFNIIGIKHVINRDDHYITLVLKDSINELRSQKTFSNPEIVINGTYNSEYEMQSGDTNYMWSASIDNFPSEEIASVQWSFYGTPEIGTGGNTYINSVYHSTSLTPTWNYDIPNTYGLDDDWEAGPGIKKIVLLITTLDGWQVGSTIDILVDAAVPHADFTFSTNTNNGVTTFTDLSYDAQYWTWNFGDGSATSSLQNPTHSYIIGGTYTITLTVSNGVVTDTYSSPITIVAQKIPVRYVKFKCSGVSTQTTPGNYTAAPLTSWSNVKVWGTVYPNVTQELAFNKPATKIETSGYIHNFLTSGPGTTSPSGFKYWDTTADPYRVTDQYNSTRIGFFPVYSSGSTIRTFNMAVVIDLQTTNLFLSNMQIVSGENVTQGFLPNIVEVSADGTNWYEIGYIQANFNPTTPFGTNRTWNLIPTVTMPPLYYS
jgi:PKD repeat protein